MAYDGRYRQDILKRLVKIKNIGNKPSLIEYFKHLVDRIVTKLTKLAGSVVAGYSLYTKL